MAGFCTRSGGAIIWVAPQKEAGSILPLIKEMGSSESAGDFHRRLLEDKIPDHLRPFGISYIMQVVYFKELAEKFTVVHVTEGLSPEQVKMMKFSYSSNIQEAINQVSAKDAQGGCRSLSLRRQYHPGSPIILYLPQHLFQKRRIKLFKKFDYIPSSPRPNSCRDLHG